MRRGLFISFEGGDGAGKSTQITRLREHLRSGGFDVLVTREPGGTSISEHIREILLDPEHREMHPVTECLLYAAARAQLVAEVIRPAVEEGRIVICDRFVDSSIAYQAWGRELGDMVRDVNRYGIGSCMPDLTVYLRVDPGTGRARIADRPQDRIEAESETFHQRVFQGYEELCAADPERILVVDAAGSIEEIAEKIRTEVSARMEQLK